MADEKLMPSEFFRDDIEEYIALHGLESLADLVLEIASDRIDRERKNGNTEAWNIWRHRWGAASTWQEVIQGRKQMGEKL